MTFVEAFPEVMEIEHIATPDKLEEMFQQVRDDLRQQYPEWDDYGLNYWAVRMVMLDMGNGVELLMSEPEDPRTIVLLIHPCYGS